MGRLFSSPHGEQNYIHFDRVENIERIVDRLEPYLDDFDAIAVSGASMMLISSVVAYRLGKNIILIRKENEKCYSTNNVEGMTGQRYIIVDDLVASGRTLRYIITSIGAYLSDCKLIGIGTYFKRMAFTEDGLDFIKSVNSNIKFYDFIAEDEYN
jgi:orotate phosphoribosyltransferase-like protein